MKILILADLHHGHNMTQKFLEYELSLFDWFEEIIKEEAVDAIINLGDTHDKQMSVSPKTVALFKERHLRLRSLVDSYYVLTGNHDSYYKTSNKITSLPLFFDETFEKIENDPVVLPSIDGDLVFIPWISPHNAEVVKSVVSENNKKGNYLFCHLEASGFKNGAITTRHDQLYVSDYGKYRAVLSGHYHAKQTKGNLTFVGNCFQKTFGELERKFVHVLDTFTGELKEFENTNEVFKRINVDSGLSEEQIRSQLSDVTDKVVRLYIDSDDFDYISKVERVLEQMKPYEVSVKTKNVIVETDVEIEQKTEEELNELFLESLDFPNDELRAEFKAEFGKFWNRAVAKEV